MSYKYLNTPERLTFSGEALAIVQIDPVLNAAMAANGYPADALALGITLEQDARELRLGQDTEYVNRLELSQQVVSLEKELRTFIQADRSMVRAALRSLSGRYRQLRLSQKMRNKRAELLQQARNIYLEIQTHEDVMNALGAVNIPADLIISRLELVASFAGSLEQQQLQQAEAQVATRKRREAMKALDDWMMDFLSTARFVFRKEPVQLKKLGLPIRRVRKQNAEEEATANPEAGEPSDAKANPGAVTASDGAAASDSGTTLAG